VRLSKKIDKFSCYALNLNVTITYNNLALAGAESNQEPIGGPQHGTKEDFHSRSHKFRRQTVPLSTTNLFQVSNMPLRAHQITVSSENTPRMLRREDFQSKPVMPTVPTNAKTRHHAPPLFTQEMYPAAILQPSTDHELVREISLRPRTKASPRATAFLKHTHRSNAVTGVSSRSVNSAAAVVIVSHDNNSQSVGQDSFCDVSKSSSGENSSPQICPDTTAFAVPGEEQNVKQMVSLVDIRYAHLPFLFVWRVSFRALLSSG
jgi:hypothetical protein